MYLHPCLLNVTAVILRLKLFILSYFINEIGNIFIHRYESNQNSFKQVYF